MSYFASRDYTISCIYNTVSECVLFGKPTVKWCTASKAIEIVTPTMKPNSILFTRLYPLLSNVS